MSVTSKTSRVVCLLVCMVSAAPGLFAGKALAAASHGKVVAASDGQGNVRLLWLVKAQNWPAGGWRIQDDKGSVLIKQLKPGQPKLMSALRESDQKLIRRLSGLHNVRDAKKRRQILGMAGWRVISDWDFARAAGLAAELHWLPAGKRRFSIIALNAKGQPTRNVLQTALVDPRSATPIPNPPRHIKAIQDENSIELFWAPAAAHKRERVFTYIVSRIDQTGTQAVLNEPGQIYLFNKHAPVFIDWTPPVEQEVNYQVFAIDALGRRSLPATASLFVGDYDALRPPDDLTASAAAGKVTLKWARVKNQNTAGIFIARAFLHQGPFEFLQTKPLPVDSTSFVDEAVKGGSNYFYRVYSMNRRGDLGPPSDTVAAQPRGTAPPLVPSKLRARVGTTRVRLSWRAVPCAGYIVERRDPDERKWTRLNERLTPEPRFDDHIGSGNGGRLEYRVIAVAQDNQNSGPSDIVKVRLPDSIPPPAPRIIGASSANGQVVLRFSPGQPQAQSRQFLVLRAGRAGEPGLVLGDPLPADVRRYTDDWVQAGQTYWYQLAAIDAAGNRSRLSDAVRVYVENPKIPVASKPDVAFQQKPIRLVKLKFDAPPRGFLAIVESSSDGKHWNHVYGPATGDSAVDTNPPLHGMVRYRLIYQAQNGVLGQPSQTASLSLK